MTRRHLLVAGGGGGGGEPIGPTPTDPTLTEPRVITAPQSINQNTIGVDATGGRTWQYEPYTVIEDSASLRLLFGGMSQGFITDPCTIKAAVRKPGQAWVPVLFDGSATGTLPRDGWLQSDTLDLVTPEGTTFEVRVWSATGQTINVSSPGATTPGEHLTETSLPSPDTYTTGGPSPVAVIGTSRATVVCPGLYGDSIAAQGEWWRTALHTNGLPGINFGRNVMTFNGRWLSEEAVAPLTHMLFQFGVNDLGPGTTVSVMWTNAVADYAYVDGLKPGLPMWQTTPTPTVDDTAGDGCATLAGQTLSGPRPAARLAWTAFLRDGAPCHPDTLAALSVGTTGTVIRAGDDGHPLKGIVDIAAAVEHGGSSSPSGKWRIDLGPLGGDGVHPSGLGQAAMAPPVTAWAATLTVDDSDPGPVDETAPTAGTLAATDITDTTFTLTVTGATDDTGLHVAPYAFSTNNGSTWTGYQSSPAYDATGMSTDTAYTCKHRVRDAAGNVTTGSSIVVTTDSAGEFTPPSGLAGWWDAADADTFTYSSGTLVAQWADKSGLAHHFLQGNTGKQPQRNATQNGLPCLAFDGIDDVLDTAAFTLPQPLTAIIAADYPTGTSATLSSVGSNLQLAYGGTGRLAYYAGSAEVDVVSSGFTGGPRVVTFTLNGSSSASWIDGAAKGAGNPGTSGTTTGLRIAERNLSSFMGGKVFEILVFSAALSPTDRALVEDYLAAKWATP